MRRLVLLTLGAATLCSAAVVNGCSEDERPGLASTTSTGGKKATGGSEATETGGSSTGGTGGMGGDPVWPPVAPWEVREASYRRGHSVRKPLRERQGLRAAKSRMHLL
jgi:hypothetical protein